MFLPEYTFEHIAGLLKDSGTFYLVKLDMQGNYVYLNDHFVSRNSAYYDHHTIKPASTALHPDDHGLSYETFLKCIASPGQSFPVQLRKLDGKGGYIISAWEYYASPLPSGELDGVIGIGYDITTFESHKDYIAHLTGTLNKLAAQQSHLLRRPLANLLGLVDVLEQQTREDSQELQDIAAMLRQSCTALNEEFEGFLLRNFSTKDSHDNG